jgi:membrane protein implicated in regulation of membrane protease activity
MPWWIWLLIAIAAFVGESATTALYLLYFGVAAFVVAILALVGAVPLVQLAVFVVLAVGLLGVVRPRTLHLLVARQVPRAFLTNQGVRPDRLGVVVEDVDSDSGMVRLGSAEFWSARSFDPAVQISRGTRVRVMHVHGLTAYVEPLASPSPPAQDPLTPPQGHVVGEEPTGDKVMS